MKAIELTEDHKSKLLEMCKILLPEYNKIWFEDYSYSEYIRGSEHKDGIGFFIHWFEFCCNILVNKLFDNSFDFGKIYYELLTSNNSVDYLYEEFKKNNKLCM